MIRCWRTDDPAADTAAADRQYAANLAQWNERSPANAASPDYNLAGYAADPDHVSGIVALDQLLLGEVRGLHGVHLQCHLGIDIISLARLGARLTGLDNSPAAIAEAARCRSGAVSHRLLDRATSRDVVRSSLQADRRNRT